ncbi:N-acetylmuramic acid 6-phosphate etherase [Tengunoibacter tsumagoiensis]|uniref:N-acetylmuramic acid 6-phosphate etherase n=1 Tax=Tengunoibacter tsumagoiensis TaxID=2014871 RepID=A0A402A6L3_9CHLR|nr:N-acetylmuramic acid 6-phosphate etherase [Tengunoibacter tsumagoiensis]GCE14729.1 N-acetylmuramic acid 6-phosphate etherase [Tengunoibacter tsumagoiensis]
MATEPETSVAVSELVTEQVNPATVAIDQMNGHEIARVMNDEDAQVALAIKQELSQIGLAIEAIAARMRSGGRLLYLGAGTSGRLGVLDASECPPTFNVPSSLVVGCLAGGDEAIAHASEQVEDSYESGLADCQRLAITAQDSVVALAASGRTPYALAAAAYAREQGALSIGLACNSPSPLAELVEIMIAPVVGPEVITGSTRLKAGTAQKMVLNMLSTGVMVLLGKTYGNLMVDVQATNYKLHQRALKIVQLATGFDPQRSEELLQQADGETKTAIVMGRAQVSAQIAREQLATHNAILRTTLEALNV